MRRTAALLLLLLVPGAHGASRARYGGTLRVSLQAKELPEDPLLADTPEEAAVMALLTPALCRPSLHGPVPVLASLTAAGPLNVTVKLRPNQTLSSGQRLTARDVARAWQRLAEGRPASVYRALLAPLRGRGTYLTGAALDADTLQLPLSYPFPDLLTSLCHAALAVRVPLGRGAEGAGPYRPSGATGVATVNAAFPEGRPYPDRLELSAAEGRASGKLFALRNADLLLGMSADPALSSGPALYATYLIFQPSAVGPDFRRAFDNSVDVPKLTKLFARAPAAPMMALLPPALMPSPPLSVRGSGAGLAARPFTLLYDAGSESARPVAERIQLALHDRGYVLQLQGLPRRELRERWARGVYDAMLTSVLLPSAPAPALALVLELAHRSELVDTEMQALGAVADPEVRDAKARERAAALGPGLAVIPLYAQGARVQASPAVQNLTFDAGGLPRLDDLFLAP